jgi:hypothetical protein
VYLTNAYPLHFSIAAAKGKERLVVFEIDTDLLDESKLHPDEDALEQTSRGRDDLPKTWDMVQRTHYYRKHATDYDNWMASLEAMGTCAYYGTIPVEAITRVAYFDQTVEGPSKDFYWQVGDTTVSVMNYMILKDIHKARLRHLFGDPVTAADLDSLQLDDATLTPEMKEMYSKRREYFEAMLADRSAITVEVLEQDVAA